MAILKCKMCGGDLEVINGTAVAECEYCGSKQTVPNADNEKKMTLFSRANRLRMGCDFDKAAGVYENIVAEFPEEAEAYWGLVLCKYGIEYVDDPATGRKVPTCHRSSFESVMDDNNFDQTLENADPIARSVYREEAKQIEEIRKGIIAVSAKEQPYDIFICYKETAPDGNRTIDSVMAQDVYDALNAKGYRVFFSRITLEEKLGVEYEPYIFAALNSAKVMLVFGTDYEYFNAVWVKNEWSRYLKLMTADKEKHLIPCFKDIDAYDMPKEFSRLQAQDMGKIGWTQDLIRGIEKLLPLNAAPVQETVVNKSVATTETLLKRAFMFVSDGDFKKAKEYIEKVLDIEPENAEAYFCALMADVGAKQESQLANCISRLDLNPAYKKIMQYGSPELRARVEEYNRAVVTRIGAKNAQLQELETKKNTVINLIAKSELSMVTAKGVCDSAAEKVKQRGSYLSKLETEIKNLETKVSGHKKDMKLKNIPAWILIPVLLISVVLSAIVLYSTDYIGQTSVCLILAVITLVGGILFLTSRIINSGFVLILLGMDLCILAGLLLVPTFAGLWVEHGGPLKAIGAVFSLVFFFVSGNDFSDVFTFTVLTIGMFFGNILFYVANIIFAIDCALERRRAKKFHKKLSAELAQKTAERDGILNGDSELKALNNAYEEAKTNQKMLLDSCRAEIAAANKDYLNTAAAYGMRAENLIPEQFR